MCLLVTNEIWIQNMQGIHLHEIVNNHHLIILKIVFQMICESNVFWLIDSLTFYRDNEGRTSTCRSYFTRDKERNNQVIIVVDIEMT